MCLIVVAWKSHLHYPLVVAANRDEFYKRPTISAHFWKESPDVLGGRDLEKGGTWFGVNRKGHFAAITNFRGGSLERQGRSRGELVARFLLSDLNCEDFMADIDRDRAAYNPFNLLICDGKQLAYTSEVHNAYELLTPGIHVIGNDRLNSDRRKINVARAAMAKRLQGEVSEDRLFDLLADTQPTENDKDPLQTTLSSFFIRSPGHEYGTRASSLYTQDREGQSVFCEKQFDAKGPIGSSKRFELGRVTTKAG
jgi:uncharacterized protein with NRDE domain